MRRGTGRRRPSGACGAAAACSTCCSDRSKYGTPVSQMASISSSVRSLGYRYSRRVQRARSPTGAHQRDDRTGAELVGAVLAVAGEVLGDEHDLVRLELVDLGEDRLDVAAALRPAERRDGAEPARPVAALGDLHVRPRARALRPGQVEQVEARDRCAADRDEPLAAGGRLVGQDVDGHAEPGDLIDLGQGLGQLVAVALGHAAGDDEAGAVLALVLEGEDRVDRLLAGLVDERTRVDDHEIGRGRVVGGRHAVGEQRADELVGVDLVLGAAQGLDVEALPHGPPGYRRRRPGQPSRPSATRPLAPTHSHRSGPRIGPAGQVPPSRTTNASPLVTSDTSARSGEV